MNFSLPMPKAKIAKRQRSETLNSPTTPLISVGLPVFNLAHDVSDWHRWHQRLVSERQSIRRLDFRRMDSVIGLFEDILVACASLDDLGDSANEIGIRAGAVRRVWNNMQRNESVWSDMEKALENLLLAIGRRKRSSRLILENCKIPFYAEIGKSCERDNRFIDFENIIPSTQKIHSLYIRECYTQIASTMLTESESKLRQKFIITGTPGIGKSIFLFYLVFRLVRERKRVLLIYNPDKVYFDPQGQGVSKIVSLPDSDDLEFWNDSLWCLFDARGVTSSDLHQIPYDRCRFVLSTSPKRDLVNDFKKSMNPRIFYMPIWTEDELEAIESSSNVVADWRERFKHMGGVPRYIFDSDEDVHRMLDQACAQCSLDDCIKMVGFDSVISDHCKSVIHRLVHITSTAPFTVSSVEFASKTVARAVFRSKRKESLSQMRSWMESSCRVGGSINGFMGGIFEQYAIEMLERGGEFHCRKLVSKRQIKNPPEFKLAITASSKVIVDKVESGQQRNVLHVPTTSNYAAIDAWIPGVGAFQMTVSDMHPIKGDIRSDLRMIGPNDGKLYWVLPPLAYQSFTIKTPQSINQYAIRIPYPQAFQVE
jgi:hypothetical protein